MSEDTPPAPTKGEFEILQVLWKTGPATVREVHAEIGRTTGYTTILKLLQIMTEKGLVKRDEETRAHIYRANISEKRATGDFMRDLLDRVFGGSRSRLVNAGPRHRKTSRQELKEIRALLDEMEGGKNELPRKNFCNCPGWKPLDGRSFISCGRAWSSARPHGSFCALTRRVSPDARYVIACGFMAACVAAPVSTFLLLAESRREIAPAPIAVRHARATIPAHHRCASGSPRALGRKRLFYMRCGPGKLRAPPCPRSQTRPRPGPCHSGFSAL